MNNDSQDFFGRWTIVKTVFTCEQTGLKQELFERVNLIFQACQVNS